MNKKQDYKTVVQGEASESDDESPEVISPQGLVVTGEASESEEEQETDIHRNLPPLIVTQKSSNSVSNESSEIPILMTPRAAEAKASRPKYDTLLHRKLRESNLALHSHLVDNCCQTYLAAAKNLQTTTQQLQKSHASVQDASHNLRLLTNDLFYLEDKVDIITSCKLLPDIVIPSH